MEKELDSLREAMGRKRSEMEVLRDELSHSGRELAHEAETKCALRAQVHRLQSGLHIEEAKQAHQAEMKGRYPFFHAHVEPVPKKCGSKEGNFIPNPHKGKIGEAGVDFRDYYYYYVLMSLGEYHWTC
jgi:hypothetical protein